MIGTHWPGGFAQFHASERGEVLKVLVDPWV
jgi:hypothetical protein